MQLGERSLAREPSSPCALWVWCCFVFPLQMKNWKTSETNTGTEWEEGKIFKVLVKIMGTVSFTDYEFAFIAWL